MGAEAFVSQPPAVSEVLVAVPPAAGVAVFYRHFRLLCRILPGSFLCLSRSSSLGAVCGVAGVAAPSAGSGFSCALRLLQLVQSQLVLRLRCLLELVVLLLCLACLGLCSVRWISALVGVSVARPVVGSTGEKCHRWRFPSPVPSSRRPGSSTGLPRFFEVMDQVFFRPLLVAPSLEAPQRGCARFCG